MKVEVALQVELLGAQLTKTEAALHRSHEELNGCEEHVIMRYMSARG